MQIIHYEKQLLDILPQLVDPIIIGGGSNILLTRDCETTVLINEVKGREVVQVTSDTAKVKLGGGESWHEAVLWALENDLGGIENLSLIPGKCGAAPIQNIGAYGVELMDVFERLEAIELKSGRKVVFEKEECRFGYRDSIFKHEAKGEFMITQIYLNLTLKGHHIKNVSYGNVADLLSKSGKSDPSIQDISKAVIQIRKSKLPDPIKIPNCGSFFKNPIITREMYDKLLAQFPDIPMYPVNEGEVKVPSGWLIEYCGWKGKRIGNVGCHPDHALVICSYGALFGKEIVKFYRSIIRSVKDVFEIELIPEVNIY